MKFSRLYTISLCIALFPFGYPGRAQQDFDKVSITATRVAGSVYLLQGSGGNIGASVGEDGIVLVDDQFAPLAPKIREALKGITDKSLKFVLNTHFHGDHAGGNSQFGREATIIAQENVRKRLREGNPMDNKGGATPKEALPVVTFNDQASVHLNGEEIRAIHFPHGHTDGDSVIFFRQSNVVHMGDDFVTYGFPFVDVASGGSVSGMIAGCEKVLDLIPADAKIIPGHGPISSPKDLRDFITLLKETREIVARAAKEGKSSEQMKKDRVLSNYEKFAKGFIKTDAWIDVLYADVMHKDTNALLYRNHGHSEENSLSQMN